MICVKGRINIATKFGGSWAVSINTELPNDRRPITGKYKKWRNKGG